MYFTIASAKVNKPEPTLALNLEETSPEIQNKGISRPKTGHMYVCKDM